MSWEGKKIWYCKFVNWYSIRKGAFVRKNHAENIPLKLIPDPFLILVNNPKQPLHARNSFTNRIFWKRIIQKFKKVNFTFLSNRLSSACHSHVPVCDAYVTRIYSYVIRMSLVCTRMSSVCHSYVLVCHPYVACTYSYIIRRHSYVVLPWTADNWSIDNDGCRVIHNLHSQLIHGPFTFDRFAKNLIRKFKCFNSKCYCLGTSQYVHGRLEQ